jgi:hypothetical protein
VFLEQCWDYYLKANEDCEQARLSLTCLMECVHSMTKK